jgi:hypothetical protein
MGNDADAPLPLEEALVLLGRRKKRAPPPPGWGR